MEIHSARHGMVVPNFGASVCIAENARYEWGGAR